MTVRIAEGWGKPWWSREWWHFFRNSKALCGAGVWVAFYGKLEPATLVVADDDCRACLKVIHEEANSNG